MRIFQIVNTLNFGDAIGNDVIAKKHVIEDMGIETAVYAETIAAKVKEPDCYRLDRFPKLQPDDILIYHMGNGSPLNTMVAELNCRKIMVYHNITPYEFFTIDSPVAAESCRTGLEHMRGPMKGKFNAYIADSEFNKQNMIDMGYKADEIEVIPVCVPFDDYKQTPDKAMVKRMSDGITNIVFVGRIAPNKKHEDIIRAYAYYKKHVNPDSRLILVGSANTTGMYYRDLMDYIEELEVEDIVFPGHISFAEILAIYKTAHVFLCMSEHEGFCVPLLEAMTFDVPVIAFDACAVPETLGGSGIVVDDKDPVYLSKIIEAAAKDEALRSHIITMQRERLKHFEYEHIKEMLQDYLRRFIDKFPPVTPDDETKPARALYDLVEQNLRTSGKQMQFTQDALLHSAVRTSEIADVTELLNQNYSVRGLIEAVYLSCFNRLPDAQGYAHWEEQAQKMTRTEFVKSLLSSAVSSENRGGMRVKYDPFTEGFLPEPEEGGAAPA
ncbi:MAG: glycosyltransferase [Oscillospiraceae bacterium]|nr:glycosyltransferase [Oscillospiraceae bacterium]